MLSLTIINISPQSEEGLSQFTEKPSQHCCVERPHTKARVQGRSNWIHKQKIIREENN